MFQQRSTPETMMRSSGLSHAGMAKRPMFISGLAERICGTAKEPQGNIADWPRAKAVQASS